MVTKLKIIAGLMLVYSTMIFSKCNKGSICNATNVYNFTLGMRCYPDKDSLSIGDTVWLNLNESIFFKNESNNETIEFRSAANLGTVISCYQFFDRSISKGALNKFKFVLNKGTNVANNIDTSAIKEYLFAENGLYYTLNLGLITKDTGRFVLTISNAANVFRRNDNCNKAFFKINFRETNQHFYLLDLWRPDLVLDDIGKTKVYYFKVIQ